MEVVILGSADAAINAAAEVIAAQVRSKPTSVIGFATGRTQEGVYRTLVAHKLDWSRVTTFNLDEYVGETTFREQMHDRFFRHVQVKAAFLLDGMTADVEDECARYEAAIATAGGIDVQLLGIGENGHIGFNEPTSSLRSRTRMKTLRTGKHVLTMGVGTIMDAKRCVLLALGADKAGAVAAMVEGPLTAMLPASALQMHPHTTVIIDEPAAAYLLLADYYRDVYRHKPERQRS